MNTAETVLKNEKIKIEKFVLGSFSTNAYVVTCQKTGNSVLIDAPAKSNNLVESLKNSSPEYILLTHAHPDHIGALTDFKKQLQVPVGAHAAEGQALPVTPDLHLEEGDKISFGELQLEVIHTPGHTSGSLCFKLEDILLAGDTIFPGGPGKTFSPDGFKQIIDSISRKIFQLPDETAVFSGHGDSTTIKKEKEEYRYFSSKEHSPDLYGDIEWLSS